MIMIKKIIILLAILSLFSCTAHLYVHQVQICDTIEMEIIDTLIQWEPAIYVDTSRFYGDTLYRVWVQMGEDGEWKQFINKEQ